MDWDLPCYNGLPDPLNELTVGDFRVPVIELPEELLPKRLRGIRVRICVLLGFMALPGNIKRIPAGYMIDRALETGLIRAGGKLVEPTSGNMGVSLAYCAKKPRIEVTAIVSNHLPPGKLLPLQRHGATVVTESRAKRLLDLEGPVTSIELARQYAEMIGGVFLNQYANSWNPESYTKLIAPGFWECIGGHASLFVSAVGSTGTLLGLGSYFRRQNPELEIVATMPYLGQDIDGTRDAERLAEITHEWKALGIIEEPIDEITARGVSAMLNEHRIPAGPSSGAALGSLLHRLLVRLGNGTLDELRGPDGTIVAITTFADTLYPYG